MKEILFVSDYPNTDSIKDGMFQRIKKIDEIFSGYNKTYLNISLSKHRIPKISEIGSNIKIFKLNYFLHYKKIERIFRKSKNIYIHSLYNFRALRNSFLTDKNIIFDVHGIVPEELAFLKKRLKSYLFKRLEENILKYNPYWVFVSESMKDHYKKMYKDIKGIVYPVLPITLGNDNEDEKLSLFRKMLGLNENDIVIIYTGNTQKWQNVKLIASIIAKDENPLHKYILLTGEKNEFKKILTRERVDFSKVILESVDPSQLQLYYRLSHYGFILRDDHVLNAVACPTKLLEYMYYGIIPIVKTTHIGDFSSFEYEYVNYKEINKLTTPKKSQNNTEVLKAMFNKYKEENVLNLIK